MTTIDKEGAKKCAKKGCHEGATTARFCRLHYIASTQQKYDRSVLAREKILDNYVSQITERYPDRYLEMIKKDLSNAEHFKKTLKELNIHTPAGSDILNEYKDILGKLKKG